MTTVFPTLCSGPASTLPGDAHLQLNFARRDARAQMRTPGDESRACDKVSRLTAIDAGLPFNSHLFAFRSRQLAANLTTTTVSENSLRSLNRLAWQPPPSPIKSSRLILADKLTVIGRVPRTGSSSWPGRSRCESSACQSKNHSTGLD